MQLEVAKLGCGIKPVTELNFSTLLLSGYLPSSDPLDWTVVEGMLLPHLVQVITVIGWFVVKVFGN